MRQTIKEDKCPVCHKKAYLRRIRTWGGGYILTPTSTDRDLQEIFKKYDEVRCVICNSRTAKNFKVSSWGYSTITINNKISDGCFFVNGTF